MRTYLSPIGFNSTAVTRAVSSHGVGSDDEVVLLRPTVAEEDDRATEAIGDVRRFLREVDPGIEVSTERIEHTSYDHATLDCSELIRAASGDVVVVLGGGLRGVLLPFATAALAHAHQIDATLFFSDLTGGVEEWELPQLITTASDSAMSTLEIINETLADTGGESTSVPALTERTDRAKSTVTRHIDELEAAGLVRTWREGKRRQVRITTGGELRLVAR
jgi:CRISPR-associated protein Csa3